MRTIDEWKLSLRGALRDAMRARDAAATVVLREVLGAFDNAEAVQAPATPMVTSGPIAGAVEGLGASEVPRRELVPEEAQQLFEREVAAREAAAAEYNRLGRDASELRAQLAVLARISPK